MILTLLNRNEMIFLVAIAVFVVLVGCLSLYLVSRPMLRNYLKSYLLTYLNKRRKITDTSKDTDTQSKHISGLSLCQVLALDNKDDFHFDKIDDKFHQVYEISDAVRQAGLEKSNVIIGVDFSASNEWQGRQSFDGKSLHHISKKQKNPYQDVITVIPDIHAPFDDDNLIPTFGFGDSTTKDKSVFPFKPDGSPCYGFKEVLEHYERVKEQVRLSGPTSLVPIVNKAVEITAETGGYHILLVIMDGQIEQDQDESTQLAIVKASQYPLSIIMVGVGDGPFDRMHAYDDKLPARQFDNFHFVDYHQCMTELKTSTLRGARHRLYFALKALMEIPDQYKKIKSLGLLQDEGNLTPRLIKDAAKKRREFSQARFGNGQKLKTDAETRRHKYSQARQGRLEVSK